MSLEVLVQKAKDLINVEKFGESDPFVEVEFQGRKEKTEVIKSELNPEWNARLKFDLGTVALSPSDSIIVRVFDYEKVGRNRLLGQVNVSLAPVVNSGQPLKKSATRLTSANNEPLNSTLDFVVTYAPPPGAAPPPAAVGGGAPVAAAAAGAGDVGDVAAGGGPMLVAAPGGGGDGEETIMLDGGGSERSASPAPTAGGGATRKGKRRTRGAKAQIQHKLGN